MMTPYSVHHFFPCAVEISFIHTKVCGNAPFDVRDPQFEYIGLKKIDGQKTRNIL